MTIAGLFLLIAIAILLRFAGNRLVPVVMPTGWIRTIAAGWVGGLAGSLLGEVLWGIGPQVAGVNLIAAIIGTVVFIFLLGLIPFIKILLGKI